jgi:hypothetical protein
LLCTAIPDCPLVCGSFVMGTPRLAGGDDGHLVRELKALAVLAVSAAASAAG